MGEPTTDIFHGRNVINRMTTLFYATRPPFLTASLLPVVAALALVGGIGTTFDLSLAIITLLNVALIHSGANVLNDYFDARNGTDAINEARIFPFSGGSRFIQNGVLTLQQTLVFGSTLMGLGILLGLYLVYLSDPLILMVGLLGVLLAIFYSAPPCLACMGLGDLAVATCFGLLPVIGTCFLQLAMVPIEAWWLGGIIGCFVAAILWVNSIPDIDADGKAGKMTLPVLLGEQRARYGLPAWFGLGFLLMVIAPIPMGSYLALLAIVPGYFACRLILAGELEKAIPLTLATHASVTLLMTVGLMAPVN